MFTKSKYPRLTFSLILVFLSQILGGQTYLPMCPDLDMAEYYDLYNYRIPYAAAAAVAGGPINGEISIPIQIIYVNQDDGTPPATRNYRISAELELANEAYNGFLNFYICGYKHINSSTYFNFVANTANKVALQNLYHSETAVNVYITNTLFTPVGGPISGVASFPNFTSAKNFIALASNGVPPYTLAHELGHFFGLSHTHDPNYYGSSSNCLLVNPILNGDQVADTPPDPGPNAVCNIANQCPAALTACTLSCDYTTNVLIPTAPLTPGTFTFPAGYLTNNIMSYYLFCPVRTFTNGQIALMSEILNDPLSNSSCDL